MNIRDQRKRKYREKLEELHLAKVRVYQLEKELEEIAFGSSSEEQSSQIETSQEIPISHRFGDLISILRTHGGTASLDQLYRERSVKLTRAGTRAQLMKLVDDRVLSLIDRGMFKLLEQ